MPSSSPICSALPSRSSRSTSSRTTSGPPCCARWHGWPPRRAGSGRRPCARSSSAAWRPEPAAGQEGALAASTDTAEFLKKVRLFKHIEEPELGALGASLRERPLKKGQVLFREGDGGEEMFIVRRGSIVISKGVKDRVEQVLARIGPGDFFGEMALFDRSPRSATVQSDSDSILLV